MGRCGCFGGRVSKARASDSLTVPQDDYNELWHGIIAYARQHECFGNLFEES